MATSTPDFTDQQKSALVQLIVTGGLSLEQACSEYDLSTDQLKEWVCLFRRAVRQALDRQLRDTLSQRGLDLELSHAEFSGDLADLGVADLLQTIHMGRKDACITVMHGGEASHIWCQGGEVVDASSGRVGGEAAFQRILALERGRFVAEFGPNDRARRIRLSTPRLLLAAASSTGTRARLMHRIGDPSQVFAVDAEVAARHARRSSADELHVLSLFDRVRSLEEVLLSSGLADARALEIVATFREKKLITPMVGRGARDASSDFPAPSGNLTMSYHPLVASAAPEPVRLPAWLLACGAALCSSLGAMTAIVYANTSTQAASRGADESEPVREPLASSAVLAPTVAAPPAAPVRSPASQQCPAQLILIEGGAFDMGSNSKRPALSLARPAHRVRLNAFCLGAQEVTVAEYRACVDAGACTPAHQTNHFVEADDADELPVSRRGALCNAGRAGRDQHPINCVSHHQAQAYCRAHAGRLPTEAEWEFAARGSRSRAFPWGDEKPTHTRVNACGKECARRHAELGSGRELGEPLYRGDDGYSGTAPVGSFPNGSSPSGVHDLIGNVFEWTAEGLYDYEPAASIDPRGPSHSDSFVIRGGNFNSSLPEFLDPALRFAMHPDSYSHGVGFRCAADISGRDAAADPFSLAPGAEPAGTTLNRQ